MQNALDVPQIGQGIEAVAIVEEKVDVDLQVLENRSESLAVDKVYPPRHAHSRRDRLDTGAGQDEAAVDLQTRRQLGQGWAVGDDGSVDMEGEPRIDPVHQQLTVSNDDEVLRDTNIHGRSVAFLLAQRPTEAFWLTRVGLF